MSIVRIEHNKTNPYVVLNKRALEDTNISWGAKGLWAYLMSRPDNWNISVVHLSKIYLGKGGGTQAIYTILKELIENGYCSRNQSKNQDGSFSTIEYIITEFKNKVPHSGERDAVEPDAGQRGTNKYGVLKSTKEQHQEPIGSVDVFQKIMKKIDIPKKAKTSIASYALKKKISSEEFANAISFVTDKNFEVKTTLTRAIMWALKEKPELPELVNEEENKEIAKSAEYFLASKSWNVEALSSFVSIYSKTPTNTTTYEIKYSEENFKKKLQEILSKFKFEKWKGA